MVSCAMADDNGIHHVDDDDDNNIKHAFWRVGDHNNMMMHASDADADNTHNNMLLARADNNENNMLAR